MIMASSIARGIDQTESFGRPVILDRPASLGSNNGQLEMRDQRSVLGVLCGTEAGHSVLVCEKYESN